ncbi:MAG: hypothetical protein HC851_17440 [Acaryochloris sp. RU_4_1]|nr:hypothetical protein [Acaryochloris sp. RU_4_1]
MHQQLELDFASAIAAALDEPEQANIAWMCASLDRYLQGRSHHEQLRVAGDAIRDIAEVCYQRAERLIRDWEDRHNTEGPVIDNDFLAGMVQQTMHLDLSDLCRQPKSRNRCQGFAGKAVESVVGEISKDAVLEFVDELELGEAIALGASYEEDVSGWVGAIADYLGKCEGAVSFSELVSGVRLPAVAVWLGVLLGGFRVVQRGGFYEGREIWVG